MQIRNPNGYEFASACCNWGDYTADERCSPLRRNTHPVAPRKGRTRRVTKYDHIDPSRSAIVGVSGFWICQRFCGLSKMRACIAGGHVLAHDSQGTSCASHMRQHTHAAIYARFSMVCTISDRSINWRRPEGRFATGRCGQRPLRAVMRCATGRCGHRPLRTLKIGH